MNKLLVVCGGCDRSWSELSEQGAAITLYGHCIVCEVIARTGGTEIGAGTLRQWLDEDGIITEANRRQKEAGVEVEPCPRCLQKRNPECKVCGGLGSMFVENDRAQRQRFH